MLVKTINYTAKIANLAKEFIKNYALDIEQDNLIDDEDESSYSREKAQQTYWDPPQRYWDTSREG